MVNDLHACIQSIDHFLGYSSSPAFLLELSQAGQFANMKRDNGDFVRTSLTSKSGDRLQHMRTGTKQATELLPHTFTPAIQDRTG